jgi:hypothetical protein
MTAFREVELRTLRTKTAAQKLAAMHALWRTAWSLKAASLRALNPEWTDRELQDRVREAVAGERA